LKNYNKIITLCTFLSHHIVTTGVGGAEGEEVVKCDVIIEVSRT